MLMRSTKLCIVCLFYLVPITTSVIIHKRNDGRPMTRRQERLLFWMGVINATISKQFWENF